MLNCKHRTSGHACTNSWLQIPNRQPIQWTWWYVSPIITVKLHTRGQTFEMVNHQIDKPKRHRGHCTQDRTPDICQIPNRRVRNRDVATTRRNAQEMKSLGFPEQKRQNTKQRARLWQNWRNQSQHAFVRKHVWIIFTNSTNQSLLQRVNRLRALQTAAWTKPNERTHPNWINKTNQQRQRQEQNTITCQYVFPRMFCGIFGNIGAKLAHLITKSHGRQQLQTDTHDLNTTNAFTTCIKMKHGLDCIDKHNRISLSLFGVQWAHCNIMVLKLQYAFRKRMMAIATPRTHSCNRSQNRRPNARRHATL